MKIYVLLVLTIFPFFIVAQTIDSVAIRQVDSLIKESRTLTGKNDFEKALELNTIAEKLALEKLGRETAAYGSTCFNHGRIMHFKGDYPEAEKWYLQSKVIREKAPGKQHPDYAWSLNNLANLYIDMGQYEKAEPLSLEAKAIREKVLGKEHPVYASSLNNLANLYFAIGQYEKTELLYLEAKAIREKVLGKDHPDYASSLNNLAILYRALGQYEKAEPLNLEAKAIREKVLRKEHPDYVTSLNNLANLYFTMGQYEKAEPLFLEAKAIREKVLGKEHPDYARSLNNLGVLYYNMGQYEKAELLYLEAKAIREKVLGKEHPDYAFSLNYLAELYNHRGQYEKAEPLYLEAKAIREKALGKEHPDYAASLDNLAILYSNMGQYEKAEPLYLEAKAIREKALGKEHPDYATSLDNLAILYKALGQYKKAEFFFTGYDELIRKNILSALHHLSEKEMNQYMLKFTSNCDEIFSFTQITTDKTGIAKTCYDNSIFFKGFLLNAYNHSKQLILANRAYTEKYNLLRSYGRRLAAEYAKPVTERKGVADLEERSNALEKEIARNVAGYGEAMKQVSWKEVQQKLKAGEAAIEFVNYRYYDKTSTDSTMYAALLVKPGDTQPRFITLFDERSLDSLLQSNAGSKASYAYGLYTLAVNRKNNTEISRADLYDILWKPLEKDLAGINKIYFSPGGLLHRINMGAIPVSEKQTLADKYQLIELGSTRQLVINNKIKNTNNYAVLYGGINFNSSGDRTVKSGNWNYLPGTEREVSSLGKILQASGLKAEIKKGDAATEESFKKLGINNTTSPRILHIATHGYFFPDPIEKTGTGELVFKMSQHPMLRSGLILSGGNKSWKGQRTLEGKEDGILTAYEISQLNLSNTELVVLSACETGLGTIKGNEGVYGLQRAFKIAGAKYLIMSLWKVPDEETSSLMISFYRKWLKEKMSIPKAFQSAQKELRDSGLDPEYWAGFVLVE